MSVQTWFESSDNEQNVREVKTRAARGEGGWKFSRFWKEVGLLGRLALAVSRGEYPLATPQIATLFGTIGYVVSPVDAIPDVIPGLGLTDDAAMVAATIATLSYELVMFREWEKAQKAA